MSLLLSFKKDYINYLASIILPAIITAFTIPIFKRMLGAAHYGQYSLLNNAALITATISSGWITQSISRHYQISENKSLFKKQSIQLSLIFQLIVLLPILITVFCIQHDALFAILFCVFTLTCAMQFSMMVIAQANFLSGKTIFSESIRSIGFLALGFLLLRWIKIDFVYALFIASISAFGMSVLYLKLQTTNTSELTSEAKTTPKQIIQLAQQFFKYGAPLSLWFVVVYVYAYIDKIAMLKYFGANIQGNYQAMFDLLSKGFTLIISPVLISLFPIITLAYKQGKQADIKNLIRKIILYEILGYALVSIGYFWFGANILLQILSVPNETIYKQLGFIIITGTFIWQIAMVVNKIFELQMKSLQMLYAAIITLLLQLLYYYFIHNTNSPLMISLGYLFASVSYLFTLLLFILFSSNTSTNKL